jgi:acyl-CoA synthetase (AMP-forming)/AMP-acid ligase II
MNDSYKTFHAVLEEKASCFPDKPFIESIDQDKTITYGQMWRVCNQMGHLLKEKGFKANDRIVFLGENSLENLICFLGVLGYGATFCAINVEINEKIMQELIDKIQPRLVLWEQVVGPLNLNKEARGEWIPFGEWNPKETSDKEGEELFSILRGYPETDPGPPLCKKEDFSVVIHTSGTTARPKGAIYSNSAFFYAAEAIGQSIGLTSEDRLLECRSFSWASAQMIGFMAPLQTGATVVMARKFSQSRFFDWLRDYEITIAVGIPTVINMLLARPVEVSQADFPHLRFMTSSTAPLSVAQHLKFEENYGIKIIQLYGMGEGGWIAGNHPDRRKIGSVGRPLKYQDVRILDDDGLPCPPESIGEIEIGGPQRSYGYLNERGVVEPFGGQRLKTGDVGFLDKEGFLHITGRKKDLIIRGGVNIAPLEIDNVLLEHQDVAEAATVGVPDPIYGEEAVSYVVNKPGTRPTLESLSDHCRLKLADFKVPREILFVDSIPKTARGKIDRKALLAKWNRTHDAG